MTAFRVDSGGRIDRSRKVSFRWNGRTLSGHPGDTLASALLANDVLLVARSLKYHRPRGIVSAGSEEPNALVQLGAGARTEPNTRATQTSLFEGLEANAQNCWPSVEADFGAVSSLLSRLFVAGFYYKTFMWPRRFWTRVYEPVIRRAAGLGRAPAAPDPDEYDKMHAHVDVLIAGGGPAGLAAALAAARSGARVLIADEQNEFGGGLLSLPGGGRAELVWVASAVAELRAHPEVQLLSRTTVFAYHDHNYLSLVERRAERPGEVPCQRLWKVRAKRVILATGAHERPIVFPGNDRPGVMLASAVRTYLNRYGVASGRKVVVFTNNDSAYSTALDLHGRGIAVEVVDARPATGSAAAQRARVAGIAVRFGSAIVGVRGAKRVRAVRVVGLAENGRANAAGEWLDADAVAMSGGWSPAVHLFSHSQGKLAWNDALACFVPGQSVQTERSVGACRGTFSARDALTEAVQAGAEAARACGFEPGTAPELPEMADEPADPILPLWQVHPTRAAGKAFVDFQNDVTSADIALAVREGFESVEHFKRYTTAGMATDQGKTSNVNALAILSGITGRAIPETGTTTFRPPYTPVSFGALAGRDLGERLEPIRVTPMHAWHVGRAALFENVGQWKRPWYFPRAGEDMHRAVGRECKAVRTALGVLDASTLGKIEVTGADAGTFLDRVYTGNVGNLRVGRCRYGIMCGEDGMVFDDGVATRLAQDRFFLTTTTGGAARVLDWMEDLLQTEWRDLRVHLTSVTEQWAVVAIAGPKSRELLRRMAPEMATDREAFPFMSIREGTVAGVSARVFRISFTGELGYEIHVPSDRGLAVWEAVIGAGKDFNVTPYGTEAMHVLRAEKGFFVVGQETDGTVTPLDLGMDWIVSKDKDFIGRRSFRRPDIARPDRKQLVGVLPDDANAVLPEGAYLVPGDLPQPRPRYGRTIPALGHVTSSYWSENLGRSFALALVKSGRARIGESVWVPLAGKTMRARIVEPVFWDREGRAQDV
ncbi:MAG TPA: sarcosine oxidase subunit alpha family protein [Burkholderiales bacterium]|nr:sarcosine oxidase subunit alpha family protein [Burkholderiales bacterium]